MEPYIPSYPTYQPTSREFFNFGFSGSGECMRYQNGAYISSENKENGFNDDINPFGSNNNNNNNNNESTLGMDRTGYLIDENNNDNVDSGANNNDNVGNDLIDDMISRNCEEFCRLYDLPPSKMGGNLYGFDEHTDVCVYFIFYILYFIYILNCQKYKIYIIIKYNIQVYIFIEKLIHERDDDKRWEMIMNKKGIEMRDIVRKLCISTPINIPSMSKHIDIKIKKMREFEGNIFE